MFRTIFVILNQDLSIMPRRFMEFQEKISYHLRNGSHSWTLDKIQKSSGWNGAQTAEYAYFQNNILPGVIRQLCGWLTYGKPVTLTLKHGILSRMLLKHVSTAMPLLWKE